jgi:hypothetical protein
MPVRTILFTATAFCFVIAAASWLLFKYSPEVTLEFSQVQLQEQLASRLPAQKCVLNACIEFNKPKIVLQEGSDLLGIETNFVATYGKRNMPGLARLEGKPYYEQESGNFYLKDVKVTEFTISGNPLDFDEIMRVRGAAVIAAVVNRMPLYSVRSHPRYGAVAKHTLRSVQVVGGKLQVVLARPPLLFSK